MELLDSPIDSEFVSSFKGSFQELHVDGESVFWTELKPFEQGRSALMKKKGDLPFVDLFPSMSIRTKVHEYGGGAFYAEKGCLVFFDLKTSSLWLQEEEKDLICLKKDPLKRWADFSLSPDLQTLICICEDHSKQEVLNYLVSFDLKSGKESILHQEFDFYASPQWSPDGSRIAFLFWNFPYMPWEESSLKTISWEGLQELYSIGREKESISSYLWLSSEEILFASDRNGFSNLYLRSNEEETVLYEKESDCSSPLWVLGKKHFALFYREGKEYLVIHFCEKAVDHLAVFDRETKSFHPLHLPYTVIRTLDVGSKGIYFIGGSSQEALSLVCLDIHTFESEVIVSSIECPSILREFISEPREVVTQSSLDKDEIFGFFYPPKNPNNSSLTLPPLIIKCHSGPTSHCELLLNGEIQFWTSRGFAWLDVNYRGSSGFGRKYREALEGQWGLLDVQDCLDLSEDLVLKGLVDGKALFAKGSSSGGFTALCMAASSPSLRGAISYYGVTDLLLLLRDTHKFERFYLDSLIGNYEQFPLRYQTRSPIFLAHQILCPILLFQGDQDLVVPLIQARELHEKVALSNLIVFEGEGHGFRKAETFKSCLEAECSFYRKVLNQGESL